MRKKRLLFYFRRDLKAVGSKFYHVLYPVEKKSLLREWDLWGPLILCTFMATVLQVPQPYYVIVFNFSLLPVTVNFGLSSFILKIAVQGHSQLRPFRFYSTLTFAGLTDPFMLKRWVSTMVLNKVYS